MVPGIVLAYRIKSFDIRTTSKFRYIEISIFRYIEFPIYKNIEVSITDISNVFLPSIVRPLPVLFMQIDSGRNTVLIF